MRCGFTVVATPAGAEFRLRRPPARGARPLVTVAAAPDGAACAVFGTLHYQDDLRRRLGVPAADAGLVLAAYRRWGAEAFARLEGDFSVALWDATERVVVAARDPLGGYPLFWAAGPAGLIVSTGLADALGGRPAEVEPEYVADFLAQADQSNELPGERTAYRGVRRVPPAVAVRLDPRTGAATTTRYWDWADHVEDPSADEPREVAARYRERLRAAVRERMDGLTVAHLSGGMDSTAVALLAADDGPVRTVSLVYDRLPKLARERAYVDAVLAARPDLDAHRLPADDLLDFDAFADPPPHDEPYAGLWRLTMDRALAGFADRAGAAAALTGCGADELLDPKPYHLRDLVRRGRLVRAWREAATWAGARNGNAWEVLRPFALAGLRPGGGVEIPAWVRPDFARRHGLAGRARASARVPYRHAGGAALSVALSAVGDRPGDAVRWSLAAPRGVAYGHPFQDRRVIALGLGCVARFAPAPGPMKPLLAAAMGADLPAAVTGRRAKGHFDEVYYHGLARNRRRLEDLVRAAPAAFAAAVDPGALAAELEEASLGGPDCRRLHPLTQALCLACWLSHHDRWRRETDSPDEVFTTGQPGAPRPPARTATAGRGNRTWARTASPT